VILPELRAAAPAPILGGSVLGWVLLALVLAAIVTAGVLLTARR